MPRLSYAMQGIPWILLTGFLSVSIYTLARKLGADFHPTQIVFFYNALGVLVYLPFILSRKLTIQTTRKDLFVLRSVLEFLAFSLSFAAITQMPFAVHATLEFTSPLFGSLVAVVLLKEAHYWQRWVALAFGFIGVLLVTRPDIGGFNGASLMVLLAAMLFAGCGICIKKSTATEPPARIAFYMLALTALIAAPFAAYFWKTPTMDQVPKLVLFGALVAAVQYTVARAFSYAPVTLITPFFFLNLIWATLYGYVLFEEEVSVWTALGALCIIGGAAYTTNHARRNEREIIKHAEQASLGG